MIITIETDKQKDFDTVTFITKVINYIIINKAFEDAYFGERLHLDTIP